MPAKIVRNEKSHGVVELIIDHPERRNALNENIIAALSGELDVTTGVKCFLLRGHGGQFCSGYDLNTLPLGKEFSVLPDENLNALVEKLASIAIPTVSCVEGSAIGGGCDLAQSCDLLFAHRSAFFQMPPARIGVVYPLSGMARLASRVGFSRAKRLLLTAKRLDALEAAQWGLVDEVSDAPYEAALRMATYLAALSPISLAGTKKGFQLLQEHALTREFEGLRRKSYASNDIEEGRSAALEKRVPIFTGK